MKLKEAIEVLKELKEKMDYTHGFRTTMNPPPIKNVEAMKVIINHLEPKYKIDKTLGFDTFWNLYPKKVDKANAKKKWGTAKLYLIEADINRNLKQQINNKDERFQRDKIYIKSPLVYLNGECWNDEIITKQEDSKQWLTDDQVNSMAKVGESFEDLFKRLAKAGYNFNRSR